MVFHAATTAVTSIGWLAETRHTNANRFQYQPVLLDLTGFLSSFEFALVIQNTDLIDSHWRALNFQASMT